MSFTKGSDNPHNYCTQLYKVKYSYANTEYEFFRERIVNDIGTYERMCGIHLSLGAKHHAYKKPGIKKKFAKHHVDVFLVVDEFFLDGMKVYRDGEWCVLAS